MLKIQNSYTSMICFLINITFYLENVFHIASKRWYLPLNDQSTSSIENLTNRDSLDLKLL